MAIAYRLADNAADWDRVRAFTEPYGACPPPEAAAAAMAEDENGELVGVLFLQIALHLEPLIIADKRVSFMRLKEIIDGPLAMQAPQAQYYVFSPDERVAQMARIVGLSPTGFAVWKGSPAAAEIAAVAEE